MGSWNTGRRLPQCFLCFFPCFLHFSCCSALGGDKNVIHIASMHVHAQNTGICSVGASLYKILRKDAEQDTLSSSVHDNCNDVQNTVIYRVCASLYNILRKDVEQEKLSPASMPFAEVRCQVTPSPKLSISRSSFFADF